MIKSDKAMAQSGSADRGLGLSHQTQARAFAERLIRGHEGVARYPYVDTVGKITIGVGRNLSDRGLSVEEINLLFETDMKIAEGILAIWLPDWHLLSFKRQAALLSMAFNLGGPRLSQFVKLRGALLAKDYQRAAKEALNSRWATQVGARANEIAALIEEDE